MSSIRLRTLTDFQKHGIQVQVLCNACGHKVELDPAALLHRCLKLKLPVHLRQLEPKLRCQKCGEREANIYPGRSVRGD